MRKRIIFIFKRTLRISRARYSLLRRRCSRVIFNNTASIVPTFSRYSAPIYSARARARSIYNIWNFLENLAATFAINITFRRANQPTAGEIPFEFIPVVRISGFTILPRCESWRKRAIAREWKIARHSERRTRWHRRRRFPEGEYTLLSHSLSVYMCAYIRNSLDALITQFGMNRPQCQRAGSAPQTSPQWDTIICRVKYFDRSSFEIQTRETRSDSHLLLVFWLFSK